VGGSATVNYPLQVSRHPRTANVGPSYCVKTTSGRDDEMDRKHCIVVVTSLRPSADEIEPSVILTTVRVHTQVLSVSDHRSSRFAPHHRTCGNSNGVELQATGEWPTGGLRSIGGPAEPVPPVLPAYRAVMSVRGSATCVDGDRDLNLV
jgi:hypothetical protein